MVAMDPSYFSIINQLPESASEGRTSALVFREMWRDVSAEPSRDIALIEAT